MKTIKVFAIGMLSVVAFDLVGVAEGGGKPYIDSAPTNDLYVRIAHRHEGANLTSRDPITVSFFTVTNSSTDLILLKPQFFVRPELFDAGGRAVPMTRYGKQFGDKFQDLTGFNEKAVKIFRGSYLMTLAHPSAAESQNLFSVEKVFDLQRPGDHKLILHVQVFRRDVVGGKSKYELVRFQPIKLNVWYD